MEIHPTERQSYIFSQIKKRLLSNRFPSYFLRVKILDDLHFPNLFYIFDENDFKASFLDMFYSDDNRYKICIKQSGNDGRYHFFYAETDKYKMLKKMEA